MKKFFLITAIAALGLGALGCETNPGGGGGEIVGDGEKSGMTLSITLPAGSNSTRIEDWDPIVAQPDEYNIENVHVFLFRANGVKAGTAAAGHHTVIPFVVGDGSDDAHTFKEEGNGLFTMLDPIPSTAGEDMRIWVGINLPYDDDDDNEYAFDKFVEFDDEDDMLAKVEAVSALSEPGEFVMFSNVLVDDIAPIDVGKTFGDMREDIVDFNDFTVDVFRTVAKVVATDETDPAAMVKDWSVAGSVHESDLKLTYDVSHWWVFQWAKSSWVAPRYDVDGIGYLNSSELPRPWTYPVGTPAAISEYDEDADTDYLLDIAEKQDDVDELSALSGTKSKYIGENARFGGSEAMNGTTTHAFISTKVVADYEAFWNSDTKAIEWRVAENGNYGAVNTPTSIWLIKWDGRDYITSSPANVSAIVGGLAALEGLYPAQEDEMPGKARYDEGKTGTPMLVGDIYKAIKLKVYEYREGFVHFLVWINKVNDTNNQYEILRNQFIHLRVEGLGNFEGTFPGYPGKEGEPEIPIDPNEDTPENPNPYPLIPTDPVDPDPTEMMVNVQIHDWIYRDNGITLSR